MGSMIPRLLEKPITTDLFQDSKTIVVLGARQVGKTTLVQNIQRQITRTDTRVLYLDCDIEEQRNVINTTSLSILSQVLQNVDLLFVDEAQRLDNPGLTAKIIHDNFSHIRVLVTGSSSLDLQNKLSDAMTGRLFEFQLFPLSFVEALAASQVDSVAKNPSLRKQAADALLPSALTFGLYPEVYTEGDPARKQRLLSSITKNYLFKDVLTHQGVKNSQAIQDLARALAYQIGSEVNETELSKRLRIDRKTIASYIDILEKAFVLVRLTPYSKNLRREIGRKYKVYFVDLGIRNALIGDFNAPNLRNDLGAMWENFLIIERMKAYANQNKPLAHYNFWRSYDGAEVDYIEKSYTEAMTAYEFKYRGGKLSRGAHSFAEAYQTKVNVVNADNYLGFISS